MENSKILYENQNSDSGIRLGEESLRHQSHTMQPHSQGASQNSSLLQSQRGIATAKASQSIGKQVFAGQQSKTIMRQSSHLTEM